MTYVTDVGFLEAYYSWTNATDGGTEQTLHSLTKDKNWKKEESP